MVRSANKLKELILGLEMRCITIIRADILHRKPRILTVHKIKKELNRFEMLNPADFKHLMDEMVKEYTALSEKFRKTPKNRRIGVLSEAIEDEFDNIIAIRNELAEKLESRAKIAELRNLKGIFYVSNVFRDCAKDHSDVQGTLLYADDWKTKVSESQREAVARFIEKHQLKSIDEVCFNKPYLITRPNCRHRLSGISVNDALEGNWEAPVYDREVRTVSERQRIRRYEKKKYVTVLKK